MTGKPVVRNSSRMRRQARRAVVLAAVAAVVGQMAPGAGRSLFSVLIPASASAAQHDTHDLPPVPSAAHAPKHLDVPTTDFTHAPAHGAPGWSAPKEAGGTGVLTQDQPSQPLDLTRSRVEQRTARSDIYLNPDGTHTAVLHETDANFQDGSGVWQPIDPRLTVADQHHHHNTAGPLGATIADNAASGPLLGLQGRGWTVGLSVAGASSVAGSVDDVHERFAGMLPGIDVDAQSLAEGAKLNLILERAPTPGEPTHWLLPLSTAGAAAITRADGSIDFVTPSGKTVLSIPVGLAFDSSADPVSGHPAQTNVTTTLVSYGSGQALDVAVPADWLSAAARVYPVTIDPTLNAGIDTSVSDAYASSANPATNYDGSQQFDSALAKYDDWIGYAVYPSSQQYTYVQWNLAPVMGKHILQAQVRSYFWQGSGQYTMWPVAQAWSSNQITWNTLPNHRADRLDVFNAPTGNWDYTDITAWTANWASGLWPSDGLAFDTAGTNNFWKMAAAEDVNQGPVLIVNYNTPPPASTPQSPIGNATVMTAQPALAAQAVTDADAGQTISYWYRIATGSDAESGQLLNSGWTGTSYTVPAGFLQDGVTYYWKVITYDGTDQTSSSPASFTVNLRLGDQPSSPMDTVGPVNVNLATGNLQVKAASPSLDAIGGSIGLAYAYNSAALPQFGLRGSYWSNCSMPSPSMPPAGQPSAVKYDTSMSFSWFGGSPAPSVGGTNFCSRWTGYLTVPYQSQNWYFGAENDDGVRIWVNNTLVLDRWSDNVVQQPNEMQGGSPVSLFGNQTVPITIDYYNHCCSSFLTVWVGGAISPMPVPSSWLSPTAPLLPQGWSLTGGDNQMLAYSGATVSDQDLVLLSPEGDEHEYVKTSSGSGNANAWTPTAEGDAVVTQDGSGNFIVHGEDGLVYTFNGLGKLTSAVNAVDDRSPASARFSWNAVTDRLDQITEPVSNRSVLLTYQTDPTTVLPPNPSCPTANGFDANAPTGALCLVRYWDGSQTNLYYLNGNLARIENWWSSSNTTNTEITDFGYDTTGRLNRIRTPLAADEVAAGMRSNDDSVRTVIAYDSAGRASRVTLPQPNAGDQAPQHWYTYSSATQTSVHVWGLAEPNGYARLVTFDSAGRVTSDQDTAGLATLTSWDSGDRLISKIAPTGLETTTVYDSEHRPTDEYGPAKTACFSGATPNGTCTNPAIPHATTAYDEAIHGLGAAYWAGTMMPTGTPSSHGTGTQDASGAVNANWGTTPPPGLSSLTNWSARFTGEILFPLSGTYTFWTESDDGSRLFIDDKLIVDYWSDHAMGFSSPGTFANSVAGSVHRIRVDYYQNSGGAALQLYWQPPGGSQVLVPGANLFPRYGLTTSHVDADGKKTATQYQAPELSLATASITDPQGTALTSTTTYESPGPGYLRPLQQTLPKGSGTATSLAYYGPTDTAPSNSCGGVVDVGMLKQKTGADPDGAGPASPIVHQYVYDLRGRIVGERVVSDAHWTCYAYDIRGRLASTTDSAGKTTSYNYSTPGTVMTSYVDSAGTVHTTTSTVDLLERALKYTDENATTTRRTYDPAGRLTAAYRQFPSQPEAQLMAYTYDTTNRLASQTEYASGTGRTTTFGYDSAGRLQTVTRPNGVITTTGYDANLGAVGTLSNKMGTTELSPWSYSYSGAGRITQEVTTNRTRAFTYDAAGRLTRTIEGTTTRNYSYDADSNRCSLATACDGSYSYDNADRLLGSPVASGYTYDGHGNLISATPTAQPGPESLNQAPAVDAAQGVSDTAIGVGAGSLTASLDWSAMPVYSSQSQTGSLGAGGSQSYNAEFDGQSYATAQAAWTQGTHNVTSAPSSTVAAAGTAIQPIGVTSSGTISTSIDWQPTTTSGVANNSVGALGTGNTSVPVSATGYITATLTWPSKTPDPNLDLYLIDPNGTQVASSTALTGNRESVSYYVSNVTYPTQVSYTLRVKAVATGSSYTLGWTTPVTANLDLQLVNPAGTVVASSFSTTAKPEQLTYSVPAGATGTYTLDVISEDYDAGYSGTISYPVLAYADVTLALKAPDGSVVASSRATSGSASLVSTVPAWGVYQVTVTNNSTDLGVPSHTTSWTGTMQGTDSWSGGLGTGASTTHSLAVDGQGDMSTSLSWTQGSHTISASPGGSVPAGGSDTQAIPASAPGVITASVDWQPSTTSSTTGGSVGAIGSSDTPVPVSASGTISATLTWPTKTPEPNLDLYLLDPNGTQVASSTKLTGTSENISYAVSGVTYPTHLTYTLRVKAVATGSSYTLTQTSPVTPNLDLQLLNPSGTVVASSSSTTAKPEVVSYTVPSGGTGAYSLVVSSADYAANYTSSIAYPVLAYADVTLNLLDSNGTTLTSARASTGGLSLAARLASAGTYSLQMVNNSGDIAVPSFTATSQVPRLHYANLQLTLKDANGTVVASDMSLSRPKSIAATVAQGAYTLEVTPVSGWATTHLTASYPSLSPKEVISYDGNDHATTIDDGTTATAETLAPFGRVLRRVVTNDLTHQVTEDTTFGYDSDSDSPSYSRPTSGATVTTYIQGPGGLLLTDVGGMPTYDVADLHGDVVGTTDGSGTFIAMPSTDEFGVGQPPASRLAWLGEHERFATGGNLDLVRMGVRIYQPVLGRFLEVDPVDGGSANAYDYANQQPISNFDLDGRVSKCPLSWLLGNWWADKPCRQVNRAAKWLSSHHSHGCGWWFCTFVLDRIRGLAHYGFLGADIGHTWGGVFGTAVGCFLGRMDERKLDEDCTIGGIAGEIAGTTGGAVVGGTVGLIIGSKRW